MSRGAFSQALLLAGVALIPAGISAVLQLERTAPESSSKVQMKETHAEPLAPGEVRAETVRMWGDAVLFVDARGRARYEAEHIPGAVLLNPEQWEELWPAFVDVWDDSKTVVVYCDGGGCEASHTVADKLKDALGVNNIFVLKGGWPAWQQK